MCFPHQHWQSGFKEMIIIVYKTNERFKKTNAFVNKNLFASLTKDTNRFALQT